jgi:hypothetical protein
MYDNIIHQFFPVSLYDGNAFWVSGHLQQNVFPTNGWWLNITNQIRCMVFDGGSGGRIVDYVQLDRMGTQRDLSGELSSIRTSKNKYPIWSPTPMKAFWMSSSGSMPEGVVDQIQISLDVLKSDDNDWTDNGLPRDSKAAAVANFTAFMNNPTVESNSMQVPFTPTAKIRQMNKWEANDPLVHYLVEDLNTIERATNNIVKPPPGHFRYV